MINKIKKKIRLISLTLKYLFTSEKKFKYQCNICGWIGYAPISIVSNREIPSCCGCGSNLRFRSIIATLTKEIFGEVLILEKQASNKSLLGMGMSDDGIYADTLNKLYSYENTFYDREPKFDITDRKLKEREGRYNFIITSDVFEHIPYPVNNAFQNLYNLLAPGGICIFSVPFDRTGKTIEHFPNLKEWKISVLDDNRVLINNLGNGNLQIFENLCFHGGSGATLEMRRFGLNDILELFTSVGFKDIIIHSEELPEWGIIYSVKDSYVISARKY